MLTRTQFDAYLRKLSIRGPESGLYHCRVEVCVQDDWRVLTDTCLQANNIPLVHKALSELLWVYVRENCKTARLKDCKVLETAGALEKGMKVWK